MTATLFETAEAPAVDRHTGVQLVRLEQLKALVQFGYDPDIVCDWTYEKAALRLNAARAETKRTMARAKSKAALIDRETPLPPTDERDFREFPAAAQAVLGPVEARAAAAYIEQALAAGAPEEVQFAVQAAVWCMDEDRVRSLAGYLVRVLKGE